MYVVTEFYHWTATEIVSSFRNTGCYADSFSMPVRISPDMHSRKPNRCLCQFTPFSNIIRKLTLHIPVRHKTGSSLQMKTVPEGTVPEAVKRLHIFKHIRSLPAELHRSGGGRYEGEITLTGYRAITMAIATTVRKAITRSSLRFEGLLSFIMLPLTNMCCLDATKSGSSCQKV